MSVQPKKYDLYEGDEVEENNNNKSEDKMRTSQTGEESNHLSPSYLS